MNRQFGGQRPVRLPILQLAALDQADDRSVGLHYPDVVEPGSLAKGLSVQIDVCLANQLSRIRETKASGHLATDAQQTALAILEVDAIRRIFHQGLEEEQVARCIGNGHPQLLAIAAEVASPCQAMVSRQRSQREMRPPTRRSYRANDLEAMVLS